MKGRKPHTSPLRLPRSADMNVRLLSGDAGMLLNGWIEGAKRPAPPLNLRTFTTNAYFSRILIGFHAQ
jgi:hypothetical protein